MTTRSNPFFALCRLAVATAAAALLTPGAGAADRAASEPMQKATQGTKEPRPECKSPAGEFSVYHVGGRTVLSRPSRMWLRFPPRT